MNDVITEQTQNDVWQDLLDVARLVRYYEALADRHQRNHSLLRFLLLVPAAGSIGTLLELLPAFTQHIAAGLVALLVAWDFISDYGKKTAVLHAISHECRALEIEWRELWAAVYDSGADANEAEARRKNQHLAQKLSEVTGWADQANIRKNKKLNEECEELTYKVMRARHAI